MDCIVTDHAPHNPNEKMLEFDQAPFGIIGLETALGLAMTRLYHPGLISLNRLIELMSTRPAEIINQPLGTLKAGVSADLTLFDPEAEWVYDLGKTKSMSRNSPFHGTALKGRVAATIVGGNVVYQSSEYFKG